MKRKKKNMKRFIISLLSCCYLLFIPSKVFGEESSKAGEESEKVSVSGEGSEKVSAAEEKSDKYAIFCGIFTHHYSDVVIEKEGFENRIIGFEIDRWTFAYFNNSYNHDTFFAGYAFHTKKYPVFSKLKFFNENFWLRGNAYFGLLNGYGDNVIINWNGISPIIYPTGSVGWKNYSVEIGVMPDFVWSSFKARLEF